MKFADVKVGLRLALGFGLVLLLMTILTAVAISRMSFMRAQMDQIVEVDSAKLHLINAMRDLVRYQSVAIRDVVMQDDFAFKKSELKKMREAMQTYQDESTQLGQLLTNAENKADLARIGEAGIKVKATLDEAIGESISENDKGAAELIRDKVRPAQMELTSELANLLQHIEAESKNSAADAAKAYENAVLLMIVFGVMAILSGIAISYFLQRSIAQPLRHALAAAESIAKGDLTQDIKATSSDEVGQLLKAMKRMSESLAGIVGDVRSSTESITTSSQEIAQGNADLSQRTEEQASSLEETASSIEELTSTVRQNTDNARQASQLAVSASDIAVKGGKVVDDVVHTMASISESSKKIVDIISVIEGIAFQTNILALNAAVEAARAGEQGRGFAVVAGEVRNLAQRSAAAAKEIKALIDDSVGKVDVGSKQVDQAGATMTEIVIAVKRVTDIMSEIAAASIEQSAGIEQVNKAITQMDEVTQQNAALVEEAAAAAEAMQEQAQVLAHAVTAFKLEAGTVASRTAVKQEVQQASRLALTHQASTVQRVPAVVVPMKERKLSKVMGAKGSEWKEF